MEEQLSDLSRFESSAHFNNEEKLVLRLAVSLTRTPSDVCDGFMGNSEDISLSVNSWN